MSFFDESNNITNIQGILFAKEKLWNFWSCITFLVNIYYSFLRSKESYSLFFFILICLNEATRIPNIPHFHVLQRIRKKRQFPLLSTPSSPIKSVIGYINRSSCHPERESDFAIGRETGSSPAILGLSSATRLITLIVSRNNPSSLTFPAPSGSSFKEETSD